MHRKCVSDGEPIIGTADPHALLAADAAELTRLITSTSGHQQGEERALVWRAAAAAAVDLYGDHAAVAFEALAGEVATEVRLLRAIQDELAVHAAAREQHYQQADPGQLARSLPGFAEISVPVLVAVMGRPGRFRDGTRFKSYAGLAPRASHQDRLTQAPCLVATRAPQEDPRVGWRQLAAPVRTGTVSAHNAAPATPLSNQLPAPIRSVRLPASIRLVIRYAP